LQYLASAEKIPPQLDQLANRIWVATTLHTNAHLDLDFVLFGGLLRNNDRSRNGLKPAESSFKFIGSRWNATYPDSTILVSCRSSYFCFIAGALDFKQNTCKWSFITLLPINETVY